jgi:hypothetical protein
VALHVVSGGGWFGASVCMLLVSWTNQDPAQHYPVNLVMERIDEFVMIPVPLVAIVTGVLLSLGTLWGFFQWYWLLVKQAATYVLLVLAPFTLHEWIVQMTNLSRSGVAGSPYTDIHRLHILASVMTVATAAAIIAVSVQKPWGRRKLRPRRGGAGRR